MPGRPLFAGHPAARRPRSQLVVSSALGCSLLITITDLTAGDSVLVSGKWVGGVGGRQAGGTSGAGRGLWAPGGSEGKRGAAASAWEPSTSGCGPRPLGSGGPQQAPQEGQGGLLACPSSMKSLEEC